MNNLPLQPLVFQNQNPEDKRIFVEHAQGAGIFYTVYGAVDSDFGTRWHDQMEGTHGKKEGFESIEEVKHWIATDHYPSKMQPYVKPTTLADAVNTLVDACHGASVKGGWWHDLTTGEPLQRNKLEMIALIHSEVSEAVEGIRKGINDDHLPQYPMEDVEMADALIRIFDYIGGHKLQTADALVDKLAYNANRADHKPENRAKAGGKKC